MESKRNKLRVATYNVHRCKGLDGRIRPARIADVLEEVNADVIALQEILSIKGGSHEKDQADFIARTLNLDYRMGAVRKLKGGLYGNIILSRYPFTLTRMYDLSHPGREERACLHAEITLDNGNALHVYNAHFGTAYFERRRQARKLLEELTRNDNGKKGTRILLGDFNDWTRGLPSRLFSNHFGTEDIRLSMGRKRTYPGILPCVHLDHIYFDAELVLESAVLHKSRLSLIASDHLPLVADFSLEVNLRIAS